MGLRRQTTSPRFHVGSHLMILRSSYPIFPMGFPQLWRRAVVQGRHPTQLSDDDKPGRLGTDCLVGSQRLQPSPRRANPTVSSSLFLACVKSK